MFQDCSTACADAMIAKAGRWAFEVFGACAGSYGRDARACVRRMR